ncbi:MAG: hypothetical protein GX159_09670 [Flavobacteriaceae bacterium]|jgi:hypothetical protein|nr:hypothetical protein [Flavobacteriaceae bacterium]
MTKEKVAVNSNEHKHQIRNRAMEALNKAKKLEAERLKSGWKYVPAEKGRKLVKVD